MIWFILEGCLALALLIFIVWWTMPRKQRSVDADGSSARPAVSPSNEESRDD